MILDELIAGLTLIRSVEPKAYFSAEHDEIFCGDPEKFTDEQKAEMEKLGWDISDVGAFHHYV